MRVAVISDVHGNLPALRAVLAEIAAEPDVGLIVCCGDTASGPLPAATVDLVASVDRLVSVRGNADRAAVASFDGEPEPGIHEDDLWSGRQLTRPQRDWLAALPVNVTVETDGLGPVLFCHATPRRDDEIVLVQTPEAHVAAMLEGVDEPTIVCGNTHMQFDRTVAGKRLVNAGSVGWSYGEPGAHWMLLGPDVEMRRTDYDRGAAADELRSTSSWPRLELFIERILLHPMSTTEATAAFEAAARPA